MLLKELSTALVRAIYNQGRVVVDFVSLMVKYSRSYTQPQNLPPQPVFLLTIGQLNNSLLVLKELSTLLVRAIYNQGRAVVNFVSLMVKYSRSYTQPQNLPPQPVFLLTIGQLNNSLLVLKELSTH